MDILGHILSEEVDEWDCRRGAALGILALAPLLPPHAVPAAVRFFVQRGLADRAELVRAEMLNAAMAVVELHGKETLSSQLPVFEQFLDSAPKSGSFDAVRQSVVLLVGSLARHLVPSDARIKPITLRLVAALSTPSQQVLKYIYLALRIRLYHRERIHTKSYKKIYTHVWKKVSYRSMKVSNF